MLSYNWNISPDQTGNNPPLHILQEALLKAGFFLDLSFVDGMVRLTIAQEQRTEGDGAESGGSCGTAPPDEDEAGSPDSIGTDSPEPIGPQNPDGAEPPGCQNPGSTDAGKRPEKPKKRRGRPPATPVNDISIRRLEEMRSEGLSLEKIAKHIGVSRRSFFRRWDAAKEKYADQDTPFSKWME